MKNVDFNHREFLEKMLSERNDLIEKSEYKRLGIIDDTEKAIIDLDAKLDLYKKEFNYCGPMSQRRMIVVMLCGKYKNADIDTLNLKLFKHGIIGGNYVFLYALIAFLLSFCLIKLIDFQNIDFIIYIIVTILLTYVIALVNEFIFKLKF